MRAARGFTLIEILVVIALMALAAGVVPVAFGKLYEGAQYRASVRAALDAMRAARLHAMSSGTETRFVVAMRERRFGAEGVPGAAAYELPAPLEMHAEMAAQELGDDGSLAVRFLPQGGASGGSLDILRPSGAGVRLRVDWFSGRVEQEALQP